MGQNRINNLALLSIKSVTQVEMDFESIIKDFAYGKTQNNIDVIVFHRFVRSTRLLYYKSLNAVGQKHWKIAGNSQLLKNL